MNLVVLRNHGTICSTNVLWKKKQNHILIFHFNSELNLPSKPLWSRAEVDIKKREEKASAALKIMLNRKRPRNYTKRCVILITKIERAINHSINKESFTELFLRSIETAISSMSKHNLRL